MKWWDRSWSPMSGCTPCSPACDRCYAERMARRFNACAECHGRGGYEFAEPPSEPDTNGTLEWQPCFRCRGDDFYHFAPTFHPERLDQPLHWKKPRRIFVNSMSDLFHEAFDTSQLMRVFVTMSRANWHTYMILTKRPERMRDIFSYVEDDPAPHLMLGVSVWDQESADRNIPILLDTPAAKRFVSYEPALGAVDFERQHGRGIGELLIDGIDWLICGGETGAGARPMDPAWALAVYEQCKDAGVPFWFKQQGTARPGFRETASREYDDMEACHEFPD